MRVLVLFPIFITSLSPLLVTARLTAPIVESRNISELNDEFDTFNFFMNENTSEATIIDSSHRNLGEGSFCWRNSYGRGMGTIPKGCEDGKKRIGLFCYEECPENYKRYGFDCHQECPEGYKSDGLFCRKKGRTYGRGAGFISESICEKKKGDGKCDKCLALWYPKCREGFSRDGCNICSPNPNCKDMGMEMKIFSSCTKKINVGRPHLGECDEGKELDAGLCYKKCRDGYEGRGPVCWTKTPTAYDGTKWVNCGMGSASGKGYCYFVLTQQLYSVAMAVFQTASLIASGGALAPAHMTTPSAKGVMQSVDAAADASDSAGDAIKVANKVDDVANLRDTAKITDDIEELSSLKGYWAQVDKLDNKYGYFDGLMASLSHFIAKQIKLQNKYSFQQYVNFWAAFKRVGAFGYTAVDKTVLVAKEGKGKITAADAVNIGIAATQVALGVTGALDPTGIIDAAGSFVYPLCSQLDVFKPEFSVVRIQYELKIICHPKNKSKSTNPILMSFTNSDEVVGEQILDADKCKFGEEFSTYFIQEKETASIEDVTAVFFMAVEEDTIIFNQVEIYREGDLKRKVDQYNCLSLEKNDYSGDSNCFNEIEYQFDDTVTRFEYIDYEISFDCNSEPGGSALVGFRDGWHLNSHCGSGNITDVAKWVEFKTDECTDSQSPVKINWRARRGITANPISSIVIQPQGSTRITIDNISIFKNGSPTTKKEVTSRRYLRNIGSSHACNEWLNIDFFTESYYQRTELCCQDLACDKGCSSTLPPFFLSDRFIDVSEGECPSYLQCSESGNCRRPENATCTQSSDCAQDRCYKGHCNLPKSFLDDCAYHHNIWTNNDGCHSDSLLCGAEGKCRAADGEQCSKDADCYSSCCHRGTCADHATGSHCKALDSSLIERCEYDTDCVPFLKCAADSYCRRPDGISCSSNDDCVSGSCNSGICKTPLQYDEACDLTNDTCENGKLICVAPFDDDNPERTIGVCKKVDEEECFHNDECAVNRCRHTIKGRFCRSPKEVGETCISSDQCATGRCSDFQCKEALAIGKSCRMNTDCRSGRCDGLSNRKCRTSKEEDNFCNENSDCTSGRCDLFQCKEVKKLDEDCNEDSDCEGELNCYGEIFNRKCSRGELGQRCHANGHCETGRCELYKCKSVIAMDDCSKQCNENSDCASGRCMIRSTKRYCIGSDGKMPDGCTCDMNTHCSSGRCEGSVPFRCRARLENNSSCNGDTDCISNVCNRGKCIDPLKTVKCSRPESEWRCGKDNACASGQCVLRHGKKFCAYRNKKAPNNCWCDGKNDSCVSGSCQKFKCKNKILSGQQCGQDADCKSGKCWNKFSIDGRGRCGDEKLSGKKLPLFSTCVNNKHCGSGRCHDNRCQKKLGSCSACKQDSDCDSGKCWNKALRKSRCGNGEYAGNTLDNGCKCFKNSDCESKRCDQWTCKEQLKNGAKCNEKSDCLSDRCVFYRCKKKK